MKVFSFSPEAGKFFPLLFFFIFAASISAAYAEGSSAKYGEWNNFSEGTVLNYPDFELRYLGSEEGPFFPGSKTHRMSPIYNFEARHENEKVAVVWSAGTGDIGPADFSINSKTYFLEMTLSGAIGSLFSMGKVNLWPEAEWTSKMEKERRELNEKD